MSLIDQEGFKYFMNHIAYPTPTQIIDLAHSESEDDSIIDLTHTDDSEEPSVIDLTESVSQMGSEHATPSQTSQTTPSSSLPVESMSITYTRDSTILRARLINSLERPMEYVDVNNNNQDVEEATNASGSTNPQFTWEYDWAERWD